MSKPDPNIMHRAYSMVEVRSVDDEKRVLKGIATTPRVDRMGDSIDPMGVEVASDIPLFLYHDSTKTVGRAKFGKATKSGIPFEASIPHVPESDSKVLKDRVDEAWAMLKHRLITAVSVGFRALEDGMKPLKGGGWEFLKTEVMELSLVPIPAQPDALITGIKSPVFAEMIRKSFDSETRAASGNAPPESRHDPGASGIPPKPASSGSFFARSNAMTLKELMELRSTQRARLDELKAAFSAEGHEITDEEQDEFDSLLDSVKGLDQQIRLKRLEEMDGKSAAPVRGRTPAEGSASRGPTVFSRNADPEDKFAGQGYIRMLFAKAEAFRVQRAGGYMRPAEYAAKRWGKSNPQLVQWIKANEVAGGGTDSGEWGAELVGIDNRYRGDFVNFLYAMTVFDRLGLRPAPKNVSVKGQDGAATGYWVGQSKAIPVSKPDFSTTDLTILKAAGICVASKELLADSDPAAEQLIRDSLVEAIAQRIDTTFLSADAASNGVSPAGILNGVNPLLITGTDEAAVRTMVKNLYSQFITDKNSSGLKFVMNPGMAKAVGLIVNALGQTSFPGLGASGGELLGDPVVTGDNVDPSNIILLKPSDIWMLDDGIDVSMSDSAMIEQNSVPTGATDTPSAATATLTSMFQEDSVAIKVVRRMSYKKRRSNVVQWISDADFDGTVS